MSAPAATAPELQIERWFNTPTPITLAGLRGKVVVIEAFQMLCPGCVARGLPQAATIAETFAEDDVMVLGLHTVFEHHAAMTPTALEAFLHEYRVTFPVGVDTPGEGATPRTMAALGLRGTPSLLLLDRESVIRRHWFGHVSDMAVAREVSNLLHGVSADAPPPSPAAAAAGCGPDGCELG